MNYQSGFQRYNLMELNEKIYKELQNKDLLKNLYTSTENISKILNAIVQTEGNNWAATILNENGEPLFTENEQKKFTDVFEPYIETIINFLKNKKKGGDSTELNEISNLMNISKEELESKKKQILNHSDTNGGIDDFYTSAVKKLNSINTIVNQYASQYGILRLEKESDLKHDIHLIPEIVSSLISKGLFGLTGTPPQITEEFLDKFKIPFRTIIFVIYLFLDVARLTVTVQGRDVQRKILTIILSLFELLRGDWKKSVLSFIGYYGMTPLLIGQFFKLYLSIFNTLSPTIQDNITYGALDTSKSLIIGVLLSIFKVSAPEEIRLPLIGVLEKIAKRKAEIDGILIEEGLSARSDKLSPTFQDLNNIQSLMDDKEFICSCEFEDLIEQVNKSAIINIILQILRIPVTKEFREYRCGKEPCKKFISLIVETGLKNKKNEVKDEMKNEIKENEIKNEVKDEMKNEVKEEMKNEIKENEIKNEVKEEMKNEIKDENEVKEEMKNEIKDENEVKDEMKNEIKLNNIKLEENKLNENRKIQKGGRRLRLKSKYDVTI